MGDVMVLAGSAGENLAEEIAGMLALPRANCAHKLVAGGEWGVSMDENVRGREVYVVQTLGDPVNDKLIELSLIISALRRASAHRIVAVVPYFAYGRQTRKLKSREPVSASDVAMLWEEMGVDHVVTVDVHCAQISGFFSSRCCLDNLSCMPAAARFLWERGLRDPVVVTPHATGATRAKEFRDVLCELAHARGEAGAGGQPANMATMAMLLPTGPHKRLELIGEVAGCDAIIIDDLIDSGKSIRRSAKELLDRGAARVIAVATHAVFSPGAIDRLAAAPVEAVVVTNTLDIFAAREHPVRRKLLVLSAAPVLAAHMCTLADLPTPEGLDLMAPKFTLHGPQDDTPTPDEAEMEEREKQAALQAEEDLVEEQRAAIEALEFARLPDEIDWA